MDLLSVPECVLKKGGPHGHRYGKKSGDCQIQLCIPATHDTFQFGVIVSASYDEYTALVKSGNIVSKHVNGWKVRSKRQI